MEFSTYRISFLWLLGLCLLLFKTGCTEAQGKRASRITSSRSFGTNVKSTSSNGLSFDCPEEFGYYPHPTDCTQYYVCVFGGALLESCTGGLMYSHELQTCDWPRNVGCELVDTSTERGPARSQSQTQQQHQQHVPSRVRFGSAFGSSGGAPKAPTVAPQYHRSPPQVIQAQVQHIPPPPPELRVPPNPVVTSRGQPKPLLDAQEDIAKLYAEAQETLPPVEEEESDRQQRVYRGQPSTVSQVQRDRDGIIHQASINAIPQSGKLGSYAFGTAYSESLDDEQTLEYELSQNRLEALDVDRRPRKRRDLTVQTTPVADTETQTPTKPEPEANVQAEVPNDSNTSSEVMEPESPSPSAKPSSLLGNSESSNSSNNSQEHYDEAAPAVSKPQKYSSKISQPREKSGSAVIEFDYVNTGADGEEGDDGDGDGDDSPEDAATGESKRRPRQLRPVTHTSTKWTGPNYRAIDAPPPPHQGYQQHQTGQSYSFGSFNPYLTPPANPGHTQQPFGSHNYNQISPGYPAQAYLHQQQQISAPNQQKPKVVYTGYNLSLPPPPLEDDFRPIAGNYFRSPNGVPSSPRTPLPAQNLQQQQQQQHSSPGDLLPYLIQQLKELKERRKHLQAENFAYFHLENQPITPGPSPGSTPPTPAAQTPFAYYSHSQVSSGDSSKPTQQVTPNGQFSTMGGFYNNQSPDQAPYTANYAGKLVSQYSIGGSTTESNYFQYNVIANQKMKGVYSTAKPNQIGHAAVKTGFLEATTTRRPFPNFVQLNSRPSNETGAGAGGVPSFINFPSDIFQELKQRLPQLPESTTPTPGAPTPRSTRPSSTPASTSTRVRYTTRPRTRGQQKWMTMAPPASATAAAKGVENNTERAKNDSSASGYYFGKQSHSSIGGLQLNSIHAGGSVSGADRNRVETSSPSSRGGAPTPNANIFVQPTPQAPSPQVESNRNYYNASIFNHGGGYQPSRQQQQQQQQQQLQPTPFQQAQPQSPKHEQQAQAIPNPYDSSYYSVYDDDIDLYRDIEYQQQQQDHQEQQQQQQQQQQQPQQQQQYQQPAVRHQQTQSTYRPLELSATPTPPQKPQYSNQPTLTYSTDYDEDINAQIEQDNVYDQPTRSPQRPEQVAIQRLNARPTSTMTPSTRPDVRHYYDTLTTPNSGIGESDYSYSSSGEYAYNSSPGDYDQSEHTLMQVVTDAGRDTRGDYDLIANVVGHTQRKTTKPPATSGQNTQATPAISWSTTKGFTTQTVRATKPTTTSTTTTSTTKTTSTTTPPPPTTTTTTTTKPQRQPEVQVPAQAYPSVTEPSTTQWPLVEDSPSSQLEHAETVFDESQNVHVQTAEAPSSRSFETSTSPKFLDFINAAAYGTSPRGNLLHSVPDKKPVKTAFHQLQKKNPYRGVERGYLNDQRSTVPQQPNKRIQTYISSDVEPQSFRSPASEPLVPVASIELVDSSSTTPGTRPSKAVQYSLQSGSHGFSLRAEDFGHNEGPVVSETLSDRKESQPPSTSTSTITSTGTSASTSTSTSTTPYNSDVDVIPTTYAPPLRIWRNGRPTIQAYTKATTTTTKSAATAPWWTDSVESSSTIRTTTTPKAQGTPSTERYISPGQSFTARANHFKDSLNRVTANPAMRFVSPYKSLENLLQEERQHPNTMLRTTARPRYTNSPASPPFLQTTQKPPKNLFLSGMSPRNTSQDVLATMATGNARNFSVSDAILSTFSPQRPAPSMLRSSTSSSTTSTTETPPPPPTTTTIPTTISAVIASSPIRVSQVSMRPRGRSRYTVATLDNLSESVDEPTTYAPRFRLPSSYEANQYQYPKRKPQRVRIAGNQRPSSAEPTAKPHEKYESYKAALQAKDSTPFNSQNVHAKNLSAQSVNDKLLKRKPIENETSTSDGPRAEALIGHQLLEARQQNSIEEMGTASASSSTEHVVAITDRPPTVKFLYSNKYRQQTAERTLAESLQNAGYLTTGNGRIQKFRPVSVLEQLKQFLAGSDSNSNSNSDESGTSQFVDEYSHPEIKAAVDEIKQLYVPTSRSTTITTTTTLRPTTTPIAPPTTTSRPNIGGVTAPSRPIAIQSKAYSSYSSSTFSILSTDPPTSPTVRSTLSTTPDVSTTRTPTIPTTVPPTTASATATATPSSMFAPPTARASRVNNVIRSSIAAAAAQSSSSGSLSGSSTYQQQQMQPAGGKANKFQFGFAPNNKNQQQHQHQNNNHNSNNNAAAAASVKCSDSTLSAKCNEIPSRNHNRNRGGTIYANQDRDVVATANRGTHPPRTRPTLKPSGTIVSKAQEFVDIYRYPPTRPDPIYPQPTPDKTAAKCRKDVCLLPDCYCGGRDIPAELPAESIPQIVLLTFDDSVNDLNKQLYTDLFEKGRVNPNGCPITATFYVSHEWTDYSQVQNLYADGHEMASHTVSHSFGEQFSQKKWTREIAGQREILAAYGGVKLSDVRGMRAPFLSVGGNKMYKMLYDSNFTYDSSMPVYENRPPSWPYTLDYKIFHDCMIPPCPTRSYPGVWQVPMVMWQDLNGGRCSMGDACSNPSDAEGVTKMIMKNFERHYTTNRAPFGLFYHAAWFTQPHHKEGFIKFLDAINSMSDVWILTNWQALQWVRDPTPISRINSFQPFQCDYSDRPKRCNNPKVCNLWHKSGVRYMKTCQPCPDIYPWTGKSGIRSSRIDNDNVEEPAAA
ncbi:GL13911 [Drosophila persimilis]|uniref:GL13911 n=1 Tax=Drosophila persimilis TaxID=7234 RepID=B4GQS5_DROPE|nr:GL13911 [Drosophila persimilis]